MEGSLVPVRLVKLVFVVVFCAVGSCGRLCGVEGPGHCGAWGLCESGCGIYDLRQHVGGSRAACSFFV
jgi:hypothetical protein